MCNLCILHYSDATVKYRELLNYCLFHSDTFSVISRDQEAHQALIKRWRSALSDEILNPSKWPGTEIDLSEPELNGCNNLTMLFFSCDKLKDSASEFPNLFLPAESNLPEDIAFYRNGKAWLYAITHEKTLFIDSFQPEDLVALQQIGIRPCVLEDGFSEEMLAPGTTDKECLWADDSRILGQEKYLMKKHLQHRRFDYSLSSTNYDVCDFCFGWLGDSETVQKCYYEPLQQLWVCETCYSDFSKYFNWTVEEVAE